MSEYAQRQHRAHREDGQQQDDSAPGLRDGELDTSVACCLDEIDQVLSAEENEREQAEREFRAFDRYTPERKLKLWQAKYAHLGLSYGWCCGEPYLVTDGGKKSS